MYNVIIINSHDTGDFISPYGYKLPTPNLENFSKESILFENAHCASPTCSPSRAALMTGTHSTTNGIIGLAHFNFNLNDPKKHLASILYNYGFETVLCGIQHENGDCKSADSQNLSSQLGYEKNISSSVQGLESADNQLIWDDNNASNIEKFIDNYNFDKKPLFLQYGMFSTHREYPSVIDKEYKRLSKPPLFKNFEYDDTQGLYKSLENMDKNFGRIIDSLKKNNQYENSIIIYTSDHGLANPFGKCFLTDDGTKVSFLMKIPSIEGFSYQNLFSHIDFCPTLFDALKIKHTFSFHGQSHYDYIKNKSSKELSIVSMINFHTSFEPCRALRTKRYKLIKYFDHDYFGFNNSNIDKSIYKDEFVKKFKSKDHLQLYDLYFDPLEKTT